MFIKQVVNESNPHIRLERDVISYWYEINPINILYGNDVVLKSATKEIGNFLREINMDGNIYIVPFEMNVEDFIEETKRLHDIYVTQKGNYIDTFNEFIETMYSQFEGVYYKYKIFLVLLDERGDLRKKSFTKNFFNVDVDVKRIMKLAEFADEQLTKKITTAMQGSKPASSEDIEFVYATLYNPNMNSKKIFDDVTFTPTKTNLKMTGINQEGKPTDVFVKYTMIDNIPDMPSPTKMFVGLQNTNYPILIVVKYGVLANKKAEREIMAKKKEIEEDIKFHRREYKSDNGEYIKNLQKAKAGEQIYFVQEEDEFLCQVIFRTVAYSEDIAEVRMQNLTRYLQKHKVKIDNLVGYQRKAMLHTMPTLNYLGEKNTLYLTLDAFASLNFLCGFVSGAEKGTLYGVSVTNGNPILIDKLAPLEHRSVTNSTTTIAICETRAGKTYLQNMDILRDYNIYGMRSLIIEPKPVERKESFAKLPSKYKKIIHYVDLMHYDSSGMLDSLVLAKDKEEAFNNAFYDFSTFSEILQKDFIDIDIFEQIIYGYYERKQDAGTIPRFTEFLEVLANQELSTNLRHNAINILSLQKIKMAHLFFAQADYSVKHLDDKYIFVYEVAGLPNLKLFDRKNKEHLLANMVYGRVDSLVRDFMVQYKDEKTKILVEEYLSYKQAPTGADTVNRINRLCATFGTEFVVSSQNLSDFDTEDEAGIFNNTGQYLIGKLASPAEKKFVCKKLQLSEEFADGFNTKYEFLQKDNNLQYAQIKALPVSAEVAKAFDTRKGKHAT